MKGFIVFNNRTGTFTKTHPYRHAYLQQVLQRRAETIKGGALRELNFRQAGPAQDRQSVLRPH